MQFLGAFAVLAALMNPVTTAHTDNPVSVSKCSITSTVALQSSDAPTENTVGNDMNIAFVNHGSKPIAAVTFEVSENGNVAKIRDVGNFAPGAKISHYFQQGLLPDSGSTSCRVASVQYEDGTTAM